ncbi:hypothetical protein G4B88_002216 [Cannabis sativa]|uniref:peroxidase n=1 Tax=Cannabis sativa TaxID=3483 RepID=A0A7J6G1H2_CANSA|nr:hypothetical protein G4B88_002216 [Cannabis sativa]
MESVILITIVLMYSLLVMTSTSAQSQQGTRVGFYLRTCPRAESIVRSTVESHFRSDPTSRGLTWAVPTGRRDGRISSASEAANLPGFTDSIDDQKLKFAAKGLTPKDLVTLVGGHTIGTTACQFFSYRLYNFTTTGNGADPTINPTFLPQLRALCPQNGDGTRRIELDTGTPSNRFDTAFFTNLRNGKGILESDQKLWTDASTRTIVQQFMGIRGLLGLSFGVEFGRSMVKMSNIGIKTGTEGEIRKVCSTIN